MTGLPCRSASSARSGQGGLPAGLRPLGRGAPTGGWASGSCWIQTTVPHFQVPDHTAPAVACTSQDQSLAAAPTCSAVIATSPMCKLKLGEPPPAPLPHTHTHLWGRAASSMGKNVFLLGRRQHHCGGCWFPWYQAAHRGQWPRARPRGLGCGTAGAKGPQTRGSPLVLLSASAGH